MFIFVKFFNIFLIFSLFLSLLIIMMANNISRLYFYSPTYMHEQFYYFVIYNHKFSNIIKR